MTLCDILRSSSFPASLSVSIKYLSFTNNTTSQISEGDEIAVIQMITFSGVNWVDPTKGEANCRTPGLGFEPHPLAHSVSCDRP